MPAEVCLEYGCGNVSKSDVKERSESMLRRKPRHRPNVKSQRQEYARESALHTDPNTTHEKSTKQHSDTQHITRFRRRRTSVPAHSTEQAIAQKPLCARDPLDLPISQSAAYDGLVCWDKIAQTAQHASARSHQGVSLTRVTTHPQQHATHTHTRTRRDLPC